jgi:hypothetical protein
VNCAGVRDALPAFALGVAPPPDVSSVELHVETCAACRKEAVDLQRAVTAFGYALAPVEPAVPELEDRVVAAVRAAAGSGSRSRAKRHKRAGVTLLAAAILIAAIGTGAVFANRREGQRLQQERAALQQDEFLHRFGDYLRTGPYADPSADVLTGMLAAADGRRGAGSALVIVSPSADDEAIVMISGLPGHTLPLEVTITNAKGRALELGSIRRLDSAGGATFARFVSGGLDGFVDVVIRDARGHVVLRGGLAEQTTVASPTP